MNLSIKEIDDENERSSPQGYFNVADSYWASARVLIGKKLDASHQENVIRFLLYHAIECFLKAYLRSKGISIHDLAHPKKYGPKINRLSSKSIEFGLHIDDEDKEVFKLMSTGDTVIRSRYFMRGSFYWPDVNALDRTCFSLSDSVGLSLKSDGIPVRVIDRRSMQSSG